MCQSHVPHPQIAIAVKHTISNLYWRNNPRISMVEYAPGYHVPADRWMQRQEGSWIDIIPQTPDQSIFFHQPSAIRRQNEMYVYGNTSSMGLQNFLTSRAELRPDSRPMFVFRHLRFTAKHKLNVFFCKKKLHVSTRGKFVSVCKPFLGTCLHNTCLTLCM